MDMFSESVSGSRKDRAVHREHLSVPGPRGHPIEFVPFKLPLGSHCCSHMDKDTPGQNGQATCPQSELQMWSQNPIPALSGRFQSLD